MSAQDISGGGVGQPLTHVFSVTPDDNADLAYMSRGLYVGGAGDLTIMTVGGTIGVFVGLSAGTILPVRAVRVYATGTSATNLLNLV